MEYIYYIIDEYHVTLLKQSKMYNAANTTQVKVNAELTEKLSSNSGIRQGDYLIPLLFNIVVDKTSEKRQMAKTERQGYKDFVLH